jgi:hypothetical protein
MTVKYWLVESASSPEFDACGEMRDVLLNSISLSDLNL